jgi:hypothetical protein
MLKNILKRLLKTISNPKSRVTNKVETSTVPFPKPISRTKNEIAMEVIAENARKMQTNQKRGFFTRISTGLVNFANYLSVLMTFIRSLSILRASSLIVKGLWFLVSVLLLNGVFNYTIIPFDFLDPLFDSIQQWYTIVKQFWDGLVKHLKIKTVERLDWLLEYLKSDSPEVNVDKQMTEGSKKKIYWIRKAKR